MRTYSGDIKSVETNRACYLLDPASFPPDFSRATSDRRRAAFRTTVTCALILSLAACGTVIDPELSPDPAKVQAYDDNPELPNAVILANSMRAQYISKVEDQILLDRSVGLLMIAAAAAAAGIGVTGGPGTAILGLGLGGVAGYTAATFLSSKPQQFIYAAGANAVQCALDVMRPQIATYRQRGRLDDLISGNEAVGPSLRAMIDELNSLVSATKPPPSPTIVHAQTAMERAENALSAGEAAREVLYNAGGDLRQALGAIENKVAKAIIVASPTLESLAASLSQSLPDVTKKFAASQKPISSPPDKVVNTSDANEDKITEQTRALEHRTAEIERIIAPLKSPPSLEVLRSCQVDIQQAGLTMVVSPSGEVPVQAPTADPPATIVIRASGGVLPYDAQWSGLQPPASEVDLQKETGQGLFTIQVKKAAKTNVYALAITDATGGPGTIVNIRIAGAAAAAGGQVNALGGQPACFDATVKKVQSHLLKEKVKTVVVNGETKTLTDDGCYGTTTEAAIKHYLTVVKGMQDGSFPIDQKGLIKTMTDLMGA